MRTTVASEIEAHNPSNIALTLTADLHREIRARGGIPPHPDGSPGLVIEKCDGGHRWHCSCDAVGPASDYAKARCGAGEHQAACEAHRAFSVEKRRQRAKRKASREAREQAIFEAREKRERVCRFHGVMTLARQAGPPIHYWHCMCGRELGPPCESEAAAQQALEAHLARFAKTNP